MHKEESGRGKGRQLALVLTLLSLTPRLALTLLPHSLSHFSPSRLLSPLTTLPLSLDPSLLPCLSRHSPHRPLLHSFDSRPNDEVCAGPRFVIIIARFFSIDLIHSLHSPALSLSAPWMTG